MVGGPGRVGGGGGGGRGFRLGGTQSTLGVRDGVGTSKSLRGFKELYGFHFRSLGASSRIAAAGRASEPEAFDDGMGRVRIYSA